MKIAITCFPVYGGSGVVASELGLALARRGSEVHFVSYDRPFRVPPDEPNVTFHRVEVLEYPLFRYPPYTLSLAARLAEVATEHDVDVLHAHYAVPHATSASIARDIVRSSGGKTPAVLTTLHGTDSTIVGSHPSFRAVTRHAIETSDCVTAVSAHLASATEETFDLTRCVRVVPNFVDDSRFVPVDDPDAREKSARPDEALLVHVSNFRPVKRAADCVEVLSLVNEKRPARLLLIGDGPDVEVCKQKASALGVEDRVAFAGMRDDLENVLPHADVFLLPSEYEAFGLAALEAMACGVPVVASDVAGLPELICHGTSGYLVPVGNHDKFAQATLTIIQDAETHAMMRREARRTAVESFTTASAVRLYEECYAEAITTRRDLDARALADGRYTTDA